MEVPRGSKITKKTVYYYFIRGPKGGTPPGGQKGVPRGVTQGKSLGGGYPQSMATASHLGSFWGVFYTQRGVKGQKGGTPRGVKKGVSTLYTVPKNRVLSSH